MLVETTICLSVSLYLYLPVFSVYVNFQESISSPLFSQHDLMFYNILVIYLRLSLPFPLAVPITLREHLHLPLDQTRPPGSSIWLQWCHCGPGVPPPLCLQQPFRRQWSPWLLTLLSLAVILASSHILSDSSKAKPHARLETSFFGDASSRFF